MLPDLMHRHSAQQRLEYCVCWISVCKGPALSASLRRAMPPNSEEDFPPLGGLPPLGPISKSKAKGSKGPSELPPEVPMARPKAATKAAEPLTEQAAAPASLQAAPGTANVAIVEAESGIHGALTFRRWPWERRGWALSASCPTISTCQ